MEKLPAYLRKPIFEKLFSIAEYSNLTREEKTMYDSSMKYKWDNKNVRDYEIAEAKKEGELEGELKGELKKALNIAREMKKDGIPTAQIAKFTGLSVEEIEGL